MQNSLLRAKAYHTNPWLPAPWVVSCLPQRRYISRNTGIARGIRASQRGRASARGSDSWDRSSSFGRGFDGDTNGRGSTRLRGSGRDRPSARGGRGGFGRGSRGASGISSGDGSYGRASRFDKDLNGQDPFARSSSRDGFTRDFQRAETPAGRGSRDSEYRGRGRGRGSTSTSRFGDERYPQSSEAREDSTSRSFPRDNSVKAFGNYNRQDEVFDMRGRGGFPRGRGAFGSRGRPRVTDPSQPSPSGGNEGRRSTYRERNAFNHHDPGQASSSRLGGLTYRGRASSSYPFDRASSSAHLEDSSNYRGSSYRGRAPSSLRSMPTKKLSRFGGPRQAPTHDTPPEDIEEDSSPHPDGPATRLPSREEWVAKVTQEKADGIRRISPDFTSAPIPYTTAASTFLYGRRSILSALKAHRRKCYNLYLREKTWNTIPEGREILKLASELEVPVHYLTFHSIDALVSKTSHSLGELRLPIHDGMCLETSPFPQLPVDSLGSPNEDDSAYAVTLLPQSKEDVAINGAPTSLTHLPHGWRKPFLLWLHGTVDMRNVGAIMRTALYFGVDIILTHRGTAASGFHKTSAGASEFVKILRVEKPEEFIQNSQAQGWKFYSAVAPTARISGGAKPPLLLHELPISPVASDPCVLVVGNEDLGLPGDLVKLTDFGVTIDGRSRTAQDADVDSLNVGIAAALLIERFCRQPTSIEMQAVKQKEEEKMF